MQPKRPFSCGGPGLGQCNMLSRCKCMEDWTGPNCKQPTYCNDFPDWEAGEWIDVLTPPHPSLFLVLFFLCLACAVSIVARRISHHRSQSRFSSTIPGHLGGGDDERSTNISRSPLTRLWGKILSTVYYPVKTGEAMRP